MIIQTTWIHFKLEFIVDFLSRQVHNYTYPLPPVYFFKEISEQDESQMTRLGRESFSMTDANVYTG